MCAGVKTLTRRVALVTGGAAGLGLAVSLRLAEHGFAVCVLARNYEQAGEVVEALKQQGKEAFAARVDVSEYASIREGFQLCVQEFGRIDAVICNAGVCEVLPFFDVTPDDWDRAFDVNARGVFFCNQIAASLMRENGGRIINITSPASQLGLPYYAAYAASKAAVDSITRTAAIALAEFNIRVNSVSPGRMDTRMQERGERALADFTGQEYEQLVAQRTKALPLQRRLSVDEVADAVIFLLSDAADFMTGSCLNITGGQRLS